MQVTTLLSQVDPAKASGPEKEAAVAKAAELAASVAALQEAKAAADASGDKKSIKKANNALNAAIPQLDEARKAASAGDIPRTPEGKVDYSQDFFSKPSYLTVSGQLNVETYASGMSSVYTFGPTFRAEVSRTHVGRGPHGDTLTRSLLAGLTHLASPRRILDDRARGA